MNGAEAVAAAVARIRLVGAPRTVLVDAGAVGAADTAVGAQVRHLLRALELDVITLPLGGPSVVGPSVALPSVAVLSGEHPPLRGCYAWYVGPGRVPRWMHPTDGAGPRTVRRILSLLGTGLAQERAGAAFRAAGAGRPTPRSAHYDAPAICSAITGAVGPRDAPGRPAPRGAPPARQESRQILRRSAEAIEECCAENGAIAAAPRAAPGAPDYWFFWQRDAAHVAVALAALADAGGDDRVRVWARRRARGYIDFVTGLGPALRAHPERAGFSRCTMTGAPVQGYGDPQHDGPAATALAVLTLLPDPRVALAVAQPFLAYLADGVARRPGFDLWELTVGRSFHAVNLGRRALRRAAQLAASVGDPAVAHYHGGAVRLADELRAFLDPAGGHLVAVRDPLPRWFAATSGLDISVPGSALLAYDVTDDTANVDDPYLGASMQRLEGHFGRRWPVNAAWHAAGNLGAGLGRFPEDCNDGVATSHGNPWPVATLWAAQFHARCLQRAVHRGAATPVAPAAPAATHRELARGYLDFVLAHTDPARISEQIDADTGAGRGVELLAWAHAELVTTLLALESVGA